MSSLVTLFDELAAKWAEAAAKWPNFGVRLFRGGDQGEPVSWQPASCEFLPENDPEAEERMLRRTNALFRRLQELSAEACEILTSLNIYGPPDLTLRWLDMLFALVPSDYEAWRGNVAIGSYVIDDVFRASQIAAQMLRHDAQAWMPFRYIISDLHNAQCPQAGTKLREGPIRKGGINRGEPGPRPKTRVPGQGGPPQSRPPMAPR